MNLAPKIVRRWRWEAKDNTSGKCRIWLIWDPNKVDVTEKKFIHGYVTLRGLQFYISTIYGLHTVNDMIVLWTELEKYDTGIHDPWLLIGDFNAISEVDDRFYGTNMQDVKIRDFR